MFSTREIKEIQDWVNRCDRGDMWSVITGTEDEAVAMARENPPPAAQRWLAVAQSQASRDEARLEAGYKRLANTFGVQLPPPPVSKPQAPLLSFARPSFPSAGAVDLTQSHRSTVLDNLPPSRTFHMPDGASVISAIQEFERTSQAFADRMDRQREARPIWTPETREAAPLFAVPVQPMVFTPHQQGPEPKCPPHVECDEALRIAEDFGDSEAFPKGKPGMCRVCNKPK